MWSRAAAAVVECVRCGVCGTERNALATPPPFRPIGELRPFQGALGVPTVQKQSSE